MVRLVASFSIDSMRGESVARVRFAPSDGPPHTQTHTVYAFTRATRTHVLVTELRAKRKEIMIEW